MSNRIFISVIAALFIYFNKVNAQAIPPSGGELTYEYIGDSSGIPHHYAVLLKIYRRADSSVRVPLSGLLSSSCFSSKTLSLKPYIPNMAENHGGVPIKEGVNCGDTLGPDSLDLFAYYYADTVVLGGVCTNFKFAYSECCRDSAISNINLPESAPMLLTAILNNVHGPNTSPVLERQPRYKFCKGQPALSLMYAFEPDVDSLAFRFKAAHFTYGNPVNYLAGYSFNHPLDTSWTSLNGNFIFNPKEAGIYTVVYELLEYRYDSTVASWISIGKTIREINYTVRDSCPDYLYTSYAGGLIPKDTIRGLSIGDTVFTIKTNVFNVSGLWYDGAGFRLVGPNSVIRPLTGASTSANPALLSDSITIKLHRAASDSGVYVLHFKGWSLYNWCGNIYLSDVVYLIVDTSHTIAINEKNLYNKVFIYPNPTDNKFTLQTGEYLPERITLIDMQGRELKSIKPISTKSEIDVSEFSSGVYLLKVDVGGQQVMRLIQKM